MACIVVDFRGQAMTASGVDDADLNITVARYEGVTACPGFTPEQIADHQLPDGFPFLVNRSSGQIIEPVFRYLYARVIRKAELRLGSALTAADNLRVWWGYLAFRRKDWRRITSLDIQAYRRGLGRVFSRRSGLLLTDTTLRQRLTHVLEFYRWANKEGYTAVDHRQLDAGEHVSGGRESVPDIRGLTYEEWRRLRPIVGPLPSDPSYHPLNARCRDRLMWEVMIHTGMRRMEVCGLTVHQIRALDATLPVDDDEMFAAKQVKLSIVKGGPRRARDAIFPVWLARELVAYADGDERGTAARVYAKSHRGQEPDALFLNHASARRDPGAPMKVKRVDAVFDDVMRRAGLVKEVLVTDPETGKVHKRESAVHCVHDLRHTAAVWRYMAERAGGNPAPWRPVMVMLGHKSEKTTQQIYLQVTNLFEATCSDAALRFFRGLAPSASAERHHEGDL